MTLAELQTKREEILNNVGIARATYGDRSVEYSDAKKALELIDEEISYVTSGSKTLSCTFAKFTKD